MEIPCKDIASKIENQLKKEVAELSWQNITPKLVTILIGEEPDQLSFVKIKNRMAERIGVKFELLHRKNAPDFKTFLELVSKKANDKETSGIIIQQPMPKNYSSDKVYDKIPKGKEIEGFRQDSSFHFPLALSVLTGLKYCILKKLTSSDPIINSIIDFNKDKKLFFDFLKDKVVTIAGRGATGGMPIQKALNEIGISYFQTNSKTKNPEEIYKKSDIIITATGKHMIKKEFLKPEVILLNVGLRKENNKLYGDYNDNDIKDIASYYTITPGGLGPLDVLYLFKNVIDACKKTV
jgi:methylenetetrahydrofolate dehydrogenase (NADP+)/methenyltetrahydrofolate cyclohydrolase